MNFVLVSSYQNHKQMEFKVCCLPGLEIVLVVRRCHIERVWKTQHCKRETIALLSIYVNKRPVYYLFEPYIILIKFEKPLLTIECNHNSELGISNNILCSDCIIVAFDIRGSAHVLKFARTLKAKHTTVAYTIVSIIINWNKTF